jgi:hypothetical protein
MATSLSGKIEEFNLIDVVSVVANGSMDGILSVSTDDDIQGKLVFWKGKLVHATYANIAGDEAVAHILSWSHGKFSFKDTRWSGVPTVKQELKHLLIDHSVMMDESTAEFGQSITGTTKIRVKVHPDSLAGFELTSDEWMVISQIQGKCSVAHVIGNLGYTGKKARAILSKLIRLGLIEVLTE